jgi:hypothetical protein
MSLVQAECSRQELSCSSPKPKLFGSSAGVLATITTLVAPKVGQGNQVQGHVLGGVALNHCGGERGCWFGLIASKDIHPATHVFLPSLFFSCIPWRGG